MHPRADHGRSGDDGAGGKIGKSEAHHLVEAASKKAVASKKNLRDVLAKDSKITAHLDAEKIANLFERWPIRASRRP